MSELTIIESIPEQEFENNIQEYIAWAAAWDGALPSDVFFGVWADLQQEKRPLEIKAQIVHGRITFTTSPESPIKVVNNTIYLEDGRELVINLEPAAG